MVRALAELERGALDCTPQPADGVTYAAKIDKGETRIDFGSPRARCTIACAGFRRRPAPGSRPPTKGATSASRCCGPSSSQAPSAPPGTVLDDALTVACGEGAVRMLEVQRPGKRPMAAAEFLRGFPLGPGTRPPSARIKHRPKSPMKRRRAVGKVALRRVSSSGVATCVS